MKKIDDMAVAINSPGLRKISAVILLFGFFLLCFVWIGLFYKMHSERQEEIANAVRETGNFARAFEEHTLRTIKSADQVALFLKYQFEKDGLAIDVPQYIREGRFANQPFVLLSVVDETGDLKASSQEPFVFSNLKDREHFKVHKVSDSGMLFISKPVLGRSSGKWSIQMTRRINKPDGSFGGMVVVSVDPFYFSEFYKQVDLGKRSVISLVGRDGIVRARQSDNNIDIGQDLSNSLLMEKLTESSRGHYFGASTVDGVSRLYNYRALEAYPLVVLVGVDEETISLRLKQRFAGYYQVAAFVSVAIVVFLIVLLRVTIQQKRAEEALKRARDYLDAKVEERTRELVAANRELASLNVEQAAMNDRLKLFNRELETEIADRKKIEEELRRKEEALQVSRDNLSLAAELANLGPWQFYPDDNLFEFGEEFYAIYGTDVAREGRFMAPEVYVREFVHPADIEIVKATVAKAQEADKPHYSIELEHRIVRRDGQERVVAVLVNIERDASGKTVRWYGANQDITARVRAEAALKQKTEENLRLAYADALTGLPNRASLNERLSTEMELARRYASSGVVMFIDLDDLKMVNDTYGHTCGDEIINTAGARIVAAVGDAAFVSRVGGDEFIVVIPGVSDSRRIDDIARAIVTLLGQRHEAMGTLFYMSASIGIAVYPADGDTAEEIIKNADNAMYAAKKDGKNRWRFYSAEMQTETYEKMLLINSLRHAMERGEFSLQYQPQILTAEGRVAGFEALLRWDSPEHGSVASVRFIPLAEQSGLIQPIGQWVLMEACRFAGRLTSQGWGDITVAVNISSVQLAADDFVAAVRNAVDEAGIEPRQLELEITESVLVASLEDATRKLTELRAFGVGLALDDFGIGYSSLTYLRILPVEKLKLDKSFIDMIGTDSNVAEIIGSIIGMAHILNMAIVAEGVETEQQLAYLVAKNCDRIQGYIFSPPRPENEAVKFLIPRTS